MKGKGRRAWSFEGDVQRLRAAEESEGGGESSKSIFIFISISRGGLAGWCRIELERNSGIGCGLLTWFLSFLEWGLLFYCLFY